MKPIYTDIIQCLKPLLADNTLRWIDMDKGQLKKKNKDGRYSVPFPCALIHIGITSAKDITYTLQDCKAAITVTLAFDPHTIARTSADVGQEVIDQHLEPLDVIARVYKILQAYETEHFEPLSRNSQKNEWHSDLFVEKLVFNTEFEDRTAE